MPLCLQQAVSNQDHFIHKTLSQATIFMGMLNFLGTPAKNRRRGDDRRGDDRRDRRGLGGSEVFPSR